MMFSRVVAALVIGRCILTWRRITCRRSGVAVRVARNRWGTIRWIFSRCSVVLSRIVGAIDGPLVLLRHHGGLHVDFFHHRLHRRLHHVTAALLSVRFFHRLPSSVSSGWLRLGCFHVSEVGSQRIPSIFVYFVTWIMRLMTSNLVLLLHSMVYLWRKKLKMSCFKQFIVSDIIPQHSHIIPHIQIHTIIFSMYAYMWEAQIGDCTSFHYFSWEED